jgi:uncharacterized membrane protein (Fun14 family)
MAEKRTIELEIQDNSKSLKAQYKEAVQELQKVSAQYGETSEQAVKAAKAAAELKDQIAFSKDLVEAFNPDAKFKAVEGAVNGVMNGFQAFTGGMALLGVESEKVEEALLKVQSVMALTEGINGIMEAKDSLLQLGTVMKSTAIGQAILTAATAAYNFVLGASSTALKVFRIALISTGIGALVVGVGLLVANFDKIVNVVKNVIGWFSGLSGTMKNVISVIFPIIGVIRLVVTALEELGVIDNEQDKINAKNKENQRKRTEAELKQIEAVRKAREKNFNNEQSAYDREIKLQQALGKSTLELQKAKINASIKYQETRKKELEQDLVGLKLAQQILGKNIVDTSDIENKIAELGNKIEDQKTELKILDIEAKKSQQTTSGSGGGSSFEKQSKEKLDLTRSNEDKRLALLQDGYEKELALAKEKAKREKEDLEANSKGKITDKEQYAAAQKLIDDNLTKDLKAIDNKYNKEARERKIENDEWFKNYEKQQAEERLQNEIKRTEDEEAAIQKRDENRILARFSMLTDEQLQEYNSKKEFNDSLAELDRLKNEGAFKSEEEYLKAVDILQDDYNKKGLQKRTDLALKYAKTFVDVYSSLNNLMNTSDNERLKSVKKGSKEEEDIKKKMFKRDKALRIVQTVMDTASNVVQSVRNGGGIPTGIPFGIAAATMGALQIAAISKAKFDGGNQQAPSAGGGGAAAPMTANFNTIGSSGINQLAQLQQTPTQAYVVSGEVTSAQALDRNRVQNATL